MQLVLQLLVYRILADTDDPVERATKHTRSALPVRHPTVSHTAAAAPAVSLSFLPPQLQTWLGVVHRSWDQPKRTQDTRTDTCCARRPNPSLLIISAKFLTSACRFYASAEIWHDPKWASLAVVHCRRWVISDVWCNKGTLFAAGPSLIEARVMICQCHDIIHASNWSQTCGRPYFWLRSACRDTCICFIKKFARRFTRSGLRNVWLMIVATYRRESIHYQLRYSAMYLYMKNASFADSIPAAVEGWGPHPTAHVNLIITPSRESDSYTPTQFSPSTFHQRLARNILQ